MSKGDSEQYESGWIPTDANFYAVNSKCVIVDFAKITTPTLQTSFEWM